MRPSVILCQVTVEIRTREDNPAPGITIPHDYAHLSCRFWHEMDRYYTFEKTYVDIPPTDAILEDAAIIIKNHKP